VTGPELSTTHYCPASDLCSYTADVLVMQVRRLQLWTGAWRGSWELWHERSYAVSSAGCQTRHPGQYTSIIHL